jgi:O-antigen/teichoic acid export membrane protein
MSGSARERGMKRPQRLGRGVLEVLIGEGMVLPTGIITAAFIGRMLGPGQYGILSVAMAIAATIEWTIVSLFSRATVKVVSETEDWGPAAATAVRLQTGLGLAGGVLLWLLANPIATALNEPALAWCLRLLAAAVPVVCADAACRNVLTGRGQYRQRALASAIRWLSRLIFVVLLVGLGLSIAGALVAGMLASLAGLLVGLTSARIPLATRAPGTHRRLWNLAVPLFALALTLRVLDKLGLVALKALGASATEAGWYAAAQNFTIAPGMFALSFSPLLLGALSTTVRRDDAAAGRSLVRNALRLVLGLMPFAAFGAGAAPEIVRLIYGRGFEPAATLAIPLLAGAIGVTMVSVGSGILVAANQAKLAGRLMWPVLPVAFVGLWFVVPRYGAMGAAIVTGAVSVVNGLVILAAVRRCWHVGPPAGTWIRSVAISAATLGLGLAWPAHGVWIVVKGVVCLSAIVAAFAALGEFSADDVRLARTLIATPPRAEAAVE